MEMTNPTPPRDDAPETIWAKPHHPGDDYGNWGVEKQDGDTEYRRADRPARVVVAPYTTEIGQAGEDYIKSVAYKGHHDLPAQFRWFALWDAMNAAALLPTEAGAEPDESELDEAWKSGFNAGFGEAMLTKDATPPAAPTDNTALVEAMECLPRSTMNCGTEWVRLEEVRAALSREAPQAVTVECTHCHGRSANDRCLNCGQAIGGRT